MNFNKALIYGRYLLISVVFIYTIYIFIKVAIHYWPNVLGLIPIVLMVIVLVSLIYGELVNKLIPHITGSEENKESLEEFISNDEINKSLAGTYSEENPSIPLTYIEYNKGNIPDISPAGANIFDAIFRIWNRILKNLKIRFRVLVLFNFVLAIVLTPSPISAGFFISLLFFSFLVIGLSRYADSQIKNKAPRIEAYFYCVKFWEFVLYYDVLYGLLILFGLIGSYPIFSKIFHIVISAVALAGYMLIWRSLNEKISGERGSLPRFYKLLLLRTFDQVTGISALQSYGMFWKTVGPLLYLRGGDLLSEFSFKRLIQFSNKESRKKHVISTVDELEAAEKRFADMPSKNGSFEILSILCNDQMWKTAFAKFLNKADLVIMDLRGYTEENQGCKYELGELIKNFNLDKLLLVIDDQTDYSHLKIIINQQWQEFYAISINRDHTDRSLNVYQIETPERDKRQEEVKDVSAENPGSELWDARIRYHDCRNILGILCNNADK